MTAPDPTTLSPATIVVFLGDIFARRGAESYLGEEVTMSEHMLQGALLAEEAGADDEMVAAALLHDIGHYTSEFAPDAANEGIDNLHDEAGARVLAPFFPERVTEAVRCHVAAKRYLCATDPAYYGTLSEASILSLGLQGGPMSETEVAEMRTHPHLDAILQVRRWDEGGKVKGKPTPGFDHYAPLLQRVVDRHAPE